MTQAITLCLLLALLVSCSRYDAVRIVRAAATGNPTAAAEALARDKAIGYASNPKALENDLKQFGTILDSFIEAVASVWGDDDVQIPRPKEYVKYTHNYLTRASVDFDSGLITVETVDQDNPLVSLKNGIVTTLLTPNDPRAVDLYSAKTIKLGDTPFLLGEVKDHESKEIRWAWRAERYADHLIKNSIRTRTVEKQTAHSVQFHMVKDHLDVRARKYGTKVKEVAQRFDVSPNLIFAVMKVESDFNPFAVSSAMAIGLMQVVPSTAGSDVYEFLNGRKGTPSRKGLFVTDTNITYGSAYLHLLNTRFLGSIKNSVSREYCVIAGYNGGAGGVLRTFDKNRSAAARKINSMPPDKVYETLRNDLPYAETRRYLYKVLEAKKHFVNF